MTDVEEGWQVLGFSDSSTPWWSQHTSTRAMAAFKKELDESSNISFGKPERSYGSTEQTSTSKITLTWDNISVSIPPRKRSIFPQRNKNSATTARPILRGVSGIVRPGTLLAVMGASGSGKTTLLNVLTSRNTDGLVIDGGDVMVNGSPVGRGIISLSAYVEQEDLFVGCLTVYEHLWFQAMLRMDSNLTEDQRRLRIDEVCREFGLNKCKHTTIGVAGRVKAISGGERKRLAFASEVLTNPPLMFCDEPTSGLDSFMAENVVQTLKQMANRGKTILCTIHQPSSQTFELFDNLLLLAQGRVAYMGPSVGAKDFFADCGFRCPDRFNPADFYIRTLAVSSGKEAESQQRVELICENYDKSNFSHQIQLDVRHTTSMNDVKVAPSALQDFDSLSPYKASLAQQFKLVIWRSWETTTRNKAVHIVRLIQNIILAIVGGLLFSGARDSHSQTLVQNTNGALFFMLNTVAYGNVFTVIDLFPAEMHLFKRDYSNGMYRTSVYFLSKTLVDVPIFIMVPLALTACLYFIVGFRIDTTEAFMLTLANNILMTQAVISFGYFASTLLGDVETALLLSNPLCILFMILGGFFINVKAIPVYFVWIEYISWGRYANEIVCSIQWHGYGNLTCPTGTNSTACYHNGEEVLAGLGFSEINMTRNFLMLLVLFLVPRFLAYLCLLLRVQPLNFKLLTKKNE